jgi:hypothetical protein
MISFAAWKIGFGKMNIINIMKGRIMCPPGKIRTDTWVRSCSVIFAPQL